MMAPWLVGLAHAATLSLDVDRALTLYSEGPVTVQDGSSSFLFYGPSDRPATWLGARFGIPVNLAVVRLTPEVGAGTSIVGTSWYDSPSSTEVRATGGLRVGVASKLSPGLYGHLGWGWGRFELPDRSGPSTESAVTMDTGGYVDLDLGGLILGGHAGYELFPPWWGNAHTLDAGVNVGVKF